MEGKRKEGRERKISLYFASPFFNAEQVEREEYLKAKLRYLDYDVWSPKEECHLDPNADIKLRKKVFYKNLDAILSCSAVFAVTDGKDMGTIWECGFAYANSVPIIYYAETLGDNPFNLMLAESGICVLTSRKELKVGVIEEALENYKDYTFKGVIE